ncbi:MAG: LEA type 2 family protein [Halobacteriales archaeon]
MGLGRKLAAGALALALVVAGLYATGVVGTPSAGVADVGDWGEVTESETEIMTTLWVNNPNPVGASVDDVRADYRVAMNDVTVAEGTKGGVEIAPGNNTVELRTYVRNERLRDWWVAYVRADETIRMRATGTVTVGTPLGDTEVRLPAQRRTMLEDRTPVISALSEAARDLEGTYTRGVALGGQEVNAGYEIRNADARWGSVNRSETVVIVSYDVHNPGDVPVPAVPDGVRADVSMNDVDMFSGGTGAASPRDVATDALIEPGETRTVSLAIRMDNGNVDDWFRSHVRNGERTDVDVRLRLRFTSERLGTTFDVPEVGPAVVDCDLQTAILVDDQTTSTSCGPTGP